MNINEIFTKTFTELTTPEPLAIHGLRNTPLNQCQLSTLFAVINYRYENLLPTTTHTDKKPFELCKALCNDPDRETLVYAIVGRLWEMEVNAA